MSEVVNTDSIKNASDTVNSTLISKGYITEELKFPVIDWEFLISDQPDKDRLSKISITDTLYNNDRNVLNILFSLTQAIDRHQAQQKSMNYTISQRDSTIDELKKKVQLLELRITGFEQRYERNDYPEKINLFEKNAKLLKLTKVQARELSKLKSSAAELQAKYDTEMRKKSLEISLLKDRLLDSRKLSNTISYGKPLSDIKALKKPSIDANPNTVYYNVPILDNVASNHEIQNDLLNPIIGQEYDGIATQLSELIENLMKENSKFSNFINELNDYFTRFNSQLSILNYRNLKSSSLLNPSDEIDLNRILKETSTEIDPFEFTSRPLLSNVYKNYHYISGLIDVSSSSLEASGQNLKAGENTELLQKLREENKVLYDNWQGAIKALEDWKSYKPSSL